MTMNDLQTRPLAEAIQDMNLVETRFHTGPGGEIESVELKYVPKDHKEPERGRRNNY